MLGSAVTNIFLDSKYEVFYTSRNKKLKKNEIFFDASSYNKKDINYLKRLKFDFIINCIGIIKSRIKNSDSIKEAIKVNSLFPYNLSYIVSKKTKIYQIATDCVFSGKKGPYNENSIHDCEDEYGKSKSLGEINKSNFYNLRCSIIGKEIKNKYSLLEWFLNCKDKKVRGFKNHLWNGLTTEVFANLLKSIIDNKIKIPNKLNLLPKDYVNKYQLLNIMKKKFKKNIIIKRYEDKKKVDRRLKTNNIHLNKLIWNKSIYTKQLTIEEMVNLIK